MIDLAAIPVALGLPPGAGATLLKAHNHVYRLEHAGGAAFLKLYTKSWYGDDIAATAFCVDHEASAYSTLAAYGLATPALLRAETSVDHSIGRPFLLTAALPGRPLTELLDEGDPAERAALLRAVGAYLQAMHRIRFAFPGYIVGAGPAGPPDPDGWQHPIWTAAAFRRSAEQIWAADAAEVPVALLERCQAALVAHGALIDAACAVPRFCHGDCHAHQFFLAPAGDGWQVTGVLDMEVASAGDPMADILKLCLELGGRARTSWAWWEPLFEGYGGAPNVQHLRLRLLGESWASFTCLGPDSWPGSRAGLLAHLIAARDWRSLFDLDAIAG